MATAADGPVHLSRSELWVNAALWLRQRYSPEACAEACVTDVARP